MVEIKIKDGECEEQAVDAVQYPAVTGEKYAGILHIGRALELGLKEISQLRCAANEQGNSKGMEYLAFYRLCPRHPSER